MLLAMLGHRHKDCPHSAIVLLRALMTAGSHAAMTVCVSISATWRATCGWTFSSTAPPAMHARRSMLIRSWLELMRSCRVCVFGDLAIARSAKDDCGGSYSGAAAAAPLRQRC